MENIHKKFEEDNGLIKAIMCIIISILYLTPFSLPPFILHPLNSVEYDELKLIMENVHLKIGNHSGLIKILLT
jgi:hypothetical protein